MASADKLPKAHEVVLEIFTVQRHVCALSWVLRTSIARRSPRHKQSITFAINSVYIVQCRLLSPAVVFLIYS